MSSGPKIPEKLKEQAVDLPKFDVADAIHKAKETEPAVTPQKTKTPDATQTTTSQHTREGVDVKERPGAQAQQGSTRKWQDQTPVEQNSPQTSEPAQKLPNREPVSTKKHSGTEPQTGGQSQSLPTKMPASSEQTTTDKYKPTQAQTPSETQQTPPSGQTSNSQNTPSKEGYQHGENHVNVGQNEDHVSHQQNAGADKMNYDTKKPDVVHKTPQQNPQGGGFTQNVQQAAEQALKKDGGPLDKFRDGITHGSQKPQVDAHPEHSKPELQRTSYSQKPSTQTGTASDGKGGTQVVVQANDGETQETSHQNSGTSSRRNDAAETIKTRVEQLLNRDTRNAPTQLPTNSGQTTRGVEIHIKPQTMPSDPSHGMGDNSSGQHRGGAILVPQEQHIEQHALPSDLIARLRDGQPRVSDHNAPQSAPSAPVLDGALSGREKALQAVMGKLTEAIGMNQQMRDFAQAVGQLFQTLPGNFADKMQGLMAQFALLGTLIGQLSEGLSKLSPGQLAGMMGQLERAMSGLRAALAETLATAAQTFSSKQLGTLAAMMQVKNDNSAGQEGGQSGQSFGRGVPNEGKGSLDKMGSFKDAQGNDLKDGNFSQSGKLADAAKQQNLTQALSKGNMFAERALDKQEAASQFKSTDHAKDSQQGRGTTQQPATESSRLLNLINRSLEGNSLSSTLSALAQNNLQNRGNEALTQKSLTAQAQVVAGTVQNGDVVQQMMDNASQDVSVNNMPSDAMLQHMRHVPVEAQQQQNNNQNQNVMPEQDLDGIYHIAQGDWLSKITRDAYGDVARISHQVWEATWHELAIYNKLPDPDVLLIEQRLRIPSHTTMNDFLMARIDRGDLDQKYRGPIREALVAREVA